MSLGEQNSPMPAQVRAVLDDLDSVDDLAIDQHVAAFELAHAKLRGLLTEQGHLPGSAATA